MSTNTPAKGYSSSKQLSDIIKTQGAQLIKKQAADFASNKISTAITKSLGDAGLKTGLSSSAINQSVQSARSASDKLAGALGGKVSSVLGSALGGLSTGKLGTNLEKKVTNLATGAITKATTVAQEKLSGALKAKLGSSIGGMLASRLSGLSDVGAKNLTGAKLVAGFLETGPQDSALVTDVYGVSDNNILNSLGDKISGFAKDKFEELRRSPGLVSDLTSMLFNGGDGWSLTKDGLKDRILGTLGGRQGLINGLSSSLQDSIVNGLGLPQDIYQSAVAVINGQNYKTSTSNMKSAREVYSMINTITGDNAISSFFDVGSESALLAGVMREAIALGVPDSVDILVEKAKTSEVAYNALYANMQVAIEYSDLDTILIMIDRLTPGTFLGQIPDAVSLILANYELPVDTSVESYENEWTALQAILNQLDPKWNQDVWNDQAINNLSAYSQLSDDARTLMVQDEDHLVATLIGSTYAPTVSVRYELQTQYPLVPFEA